MRGSKNITTIFFDVGYFQTNAPNNSVYKTCDVNSVNFKFCKIICGSFLLAISLITANQIQVAENSKENTFTIPSKIYKRLIDSFNRKSEFPFWDGKCQVPWHGLFAEYYFVLLRFLSPKENTLTIVFSLLG